MFTKPSHPHSPLASPPGAPRPRPADDEASSVERPAAGVSMGAPGLLAAIAQLSPRAAGELRALPARLHRARALLLPRARAAGTDEAAVLRHLIVAAEAGRRLAARATPPSVKVDGLLARFIRECRAELAAASATSDGAASRRDALQRRAMQAWLSPPSPAPSRRGPAHAAGRTPAPSCPALAPPRPPCPSPGSAD